MYQLGSAACSHGLVRTAWAGPIAAACRQSVLGAAGTRRARVTPAAHVWARGHSLAGRVGAMSFRKQVCRFCRLCRSGEER